MTAQEPTPQECQTECRTSRRRLTIGLPAPADPRERRIALTPEGVHSLVDRGFRVVMETGASSRINYSDERYTRQGAGIVSRAEAFGADIVIDLSPAAPADYRGMRRGALLLTLHHPEMHTSRTIAPLLQRQVTAIALDLIEDRRGNLPYADILAEIDGRAAMMLGASLLADPVCGKGILMGGVAGIVPCEAAIFGSGIAARAAARTAHGLGAMVRMFDNDVYSLRQAVHDLGQWVVGSSLHPHVVDGALRSADIVVSAPAPSDRLRLGTDAVVLMKQGAVIIDLSTPPGASFPSLPTTDIADIRRADVQFQRDSRRLCLVNPGASVARTAAMALNDTLLTTFDRIFAFSSLPEALSRMPGLRHSVVTYMGRVVNPDVARAAGARQVDISIYLTLS